MTRSPTPGGVVRCVLLQRGRSYAAPADLLGAPQRSGGLPLVLASATTDDFEAAVLTGKKDRTQVPLKLRAKGRPDWDRSADDAVVGMAALTRHVVLLAPADDAELDRAYRALKGLQGLAYSWSPPDVPGLERLHATRMRQHVRAWINEWDLVRLDPPTYPSPRPGCWRPATTRNRSSSRTRPLRRRPDTAGESVGRRVALTGEGPGFRRTT